MGTASAVLQTKASLVQNLLCKTTSSARLCSFKQTFTQTLSTRIYSGQAQPSCIQLAGAAAMHRHPGTQCATHDAEKLRKFLDGSTTA
jgi:hypothetical protein